MNIWLYLLNLTSCTVRTILKSEGFSKHLYLSNTPLTVVFLSVCEIEQVHVTPHILPWILPKRRLRTSYPGHTHSCSPTCSSRCKLLPIRSWGEGRGGGGLRKSVRWSKQKLGIFLTSPASTEIMPQIRPQPLWDYCPLLTTQMAYGLNTLARRLNGGCINSIW